MVKVILVWALILTYIIDVIYHENIQDNLKNVRS